MLTNNSYIPFTVQTTRGIIPVNELNIGDKVYEYGTSNLLEVTAVLNPTFESVFTIYYTDGRITKNQLTDLILNGNEVVPLYKLLWKEDYKPIKQIPIDYHKGVPVAPVFPDPYLAGILLTHCNIHNPVISIPLGAKQAITILRDKYNIEFENDPDKNIAHLNIVDDGENHHYCMTWLYTFKEEIVKYRIPNKFKYATIRERIQFIRGVFDTGYDKNIMPHSVGITHIDESYLKEIQLMLGSLGITSTISYAPLIYPEQKEVYRLDIVNEKADYPGFFYAIENIENMIMNGQDMIGEDIRYNFAINDIKLLGSGYMNNIVLNKKHAIYIDGNCLPRVAAIKKPD